MKVPKIDNLETSLRILQNISTALEAMDFRGADQARAIVEMTNFVASLGTETTKQIEALKAKEAKRAEGV